ncbi:hypothetical protein N9Z37_00620, partial [bacterium]|nr:hypothetical protein [bacterium]
LQTSAIKLGFKAVFVLELNFEITLSGNRNGRRGEIVSDCRPDYFSVCRDAGIRLSSASP